MTDQHLRPGPGESALTPIEAPGRQVETRLPWEIREEIGWAKALWQTAWLMLSKPVVGYDRTRRRGGFRGPLWFALVICVVAGFAAELLDALYQPTVDAEGSGSLGDILDVQIQGERLAGIEWLPASMLGAASFAGCVVGLLVGIPVFVIVIPLFFLFWTGMLHLCLRLVGGLGASAAGFQGTWAAVCYATVAFLPGVVPVIGDWVTFLWLGLLQGIGFWRLHQTTRWRAAFALLIPISIPATLWLLKWLGVLPLVLDSGT